MTKISHISWGGYDKGFYGIINYSFNFNYRIDILCPVPQTKLNRSWSLGGTGQSILLYTLMKLLN